MTNRQSTVNLPEDHHEAAFGRPILGLLFRLLHQHHAREVDAALQAAGFGDIRPAHSNVLPFLPAEGIQIGQLARLAQVRKQSMAQSVAALEKLGYVERRPDPADARATLVFLTERGDAVRPVAVAAGRRVEEEWAKLIGREHLEDIRADLIDLLAKLRSATVVDDSR